MSLRIVGIGGTSAERSSNLAALRAVLAAAQTHGASTTLLELGKLGLPMYEHGVPPTDAVERYVDAVRDADGLVWSSPLYHGTISGLFKNAIDWLEVLSDAEPPYIYDKPVGLLAVAAGGHALQAVSAMEHMVRALRGWTVPYVVAVNRAGDAFERDGTIRNEAVERQLSKLGAEIVRAAGLFSAAKRS